MKKRSAGVLLAVTVLVLAVSPMPEALAADGDLDTTFDTDGKVTTAIGSGVAQAQSVAIQSDGRIVAAGSAYNGSNYDFALARYNSNGSLDTSFDTDGKVTTGFSASDDHGTGVAIQSNGKIVVAGWEDDGPNSNFALARYNANGSLDASFDADGKVTTPIGSGADGAYSVAIQSDGMIVAAGASYNGSNYDFALARYNANGSLDTTFDTDGKVTTAFGSFDDDAFSVAVQSDGRIVAAGLTSNGANYDFALARYSSNGSLDPTFSGDGKVTTPIGASNDVPFSVAIQSDGRIVAAGYSNNGTNNDFSLARYESNGSLDATFDTDGKVTTPIGSAADAAYSVAIQSDGRIVAAGYSNNGTNNDFALARYNANGSLDATFGSGGKVTTPIGSGPDTGHSVAIQSDGKIVAAGWSNNGTNDDFALARYSGPGPASGATTVLNPTDTGRWSHVGTHDASNDGYNLSFTTNNYFTFDLSQDLPCPGAITGATLSAPNPPMPSSPGRPLGIHSGTGSPRAFTLYDVATSAADLAANAFPVGTPAGVAIYNDLGSGTVFGSMTPATVNENPIVVPFNAAGIAALNAARGGTFSVGGTLTGAVPGDTLFGWTRFQVVTLTLTIEAPFLQPDAQIKGGPASLSYLGDDIYNQSGTGQTFQRQVRPGFGDQFNVKVQNDGNCLADSFFVEGAPSAGRFKVAYRYEGADVTPDVVAGTFETPKLLPDGSVDLMVFIYARRGTRSGASMTDLITVTSERSLPERGGTVPVGKSDVVGARLVVNKKAGDFNSQLPIP